MSEFEPDIPEPAAMDVPSRASSALSPGATSLTAPSNVSSLATVPSSAAVASPVLVDLLERCHAPAHPLTSWIPGPQWGHECEDLDLTLLSWENGKRIEAHVNNEVDGVLIGVEGSAVITVNGERHELRPGVMLLIPKGCERAIESTAERFSYLSVHRRRRGLMPTLQGKPLL